MSSSSSSLSPLCFVMILISLYGSTLCSESSESKEYVVTLDGSNFREFVFKQAFVAVKFYTPWCGHCKALAPEWEKAAKILSESDPPLVLAKVNAETEQNINLAMEYQVTGLPTIKILRFGGSITHDYRGPREAEGIVAYLKKHSGPASAEIKSKEDAEKAITDKKITIVGVFPEFSGEKFQNFTTLAEKLRADIDFAHTTDAKLLPRGDSSVSGPIVRLFKPFDELFVDFQEFNADVLEELVAASCVPLVTIMTKDPANHFYVAMYFSNPHTYAKAMLFLNFSRDNFDAFMSKYRDLAEQFKGQGVGFLIGDIDEASEGAFKFFGLQKEQVPLVVIQGKNATKYLKTNVVPEEVPSLIQDFVDEKLQPYLKSEPIPVVNNEPVKVVVGATLEDMFFKSPKNVLLEFHTAGCEPCKNLSRILEKIAVSFQDDSDVLIAKMDAASNDFPQEIFDVSYLPMLFFKSSSGKISKYDGDKTMEGVISFIHKNKNKAEEQDSGKDEL